MGHRLEDMSPDLLKRTLDVMAREDGDLCRKRRGPKPPGLPTPKEDLEGEVLKECLDTLRGIGLTAWRANRGSMIIPGKDGKRDRFICFGVDGQADITGLLPNGRRFEIECKRRHGGVQTDDQRDFQAVIEASNGVYILVHSAGEMIDKLREVMP